MRAEDMFLYRKDVDVFIAWDNAFAKQLEKTMIGYKVKVEP
jgi:hypothetical protein